MSPLNLLHTITTGNDGEGYCLHMNEGSLCVWVTEGNFICLWICAVRAVVCVCAEEDTALFMCVYV